MKIIRIFIAFVVVSLVVGLGSAFNGKPVKELDTAKTNQIEHEEQKEVKNDTQIEEKQKKTILKKKSYQQKLLKKKKTYQSKRQIMNKKKTNLLNQNKNKLKKV